MDDTTVPISSPETASPASELTEGKQSSDVQVERLDVSKLTSVQQEPEEEKFEWREVVRGQSIPALCDEGFLKICRYP